MARNSQADRRQMYSWWWDSHISPKNSKWLQENLTDMDAKVKQMIKVIEEDADSFARRAEMYYKKRPELMKLVEEFYRAYRALAERYDHATGVIRQAHRQIAEAFPNQMPFGMPDDSPVGFANEGDPRTPDLPPVRAIFDPDELQKDALGNSPTNSHGLKRNGGFGDESDSVLERKGLKQLNDLFGSGIAEAKTRKGLNFHDSEERIVKPRGPSDSDRVGKAEQEIESLKSAIAKLEAEKEDGLRQYQQSMERLSKLESEFSYAKDDSKVLKERASNAEAQVEILKGSLAKLQTERETSLLQYQQCLEKMSNLESSILLAKKDTDEIITRASKTEDEAQSLKQQLGNLEAEKEEALVQYNQCLEKISDLERKLLLAEEDAKSHKQRADKAEMEVERFKQQINKLTEEIDTAAVRYLQCMERISVLESELASAQEEVKRLNAEIDDGVARLKGAEERCLLLENSNQTMHSELETLSEKMAAQNEELTEKQKELGRLWTCIQEERLRFVEAETAFQTLQHLHSQSQEELRSMAAELQKRAHILEDLEARNQNLQNEAEQVKLVNKDLNEVNLSSALTIQNLQDEISSLRETIQKLEAEVELRVDQRNALQQEIYCLKEELNELRKDHSAIVEQVKSVGLYSTNFSTSVKEMQDENIKLKEASEREMTEKVALLEKLVIMEKLVQKNCVLENSLTDLNVELETVREKVKALEESCQHLLGEKSALASGKATLVSDLQVATETVEKLTERNNSLENSLLDANAGLEQLRVKSKNLEDLCQLLENEKLDLVLAKEGLISQLDVSQSKVADIEKNYCNLEQKYFSLEKERQLALHESEDLRGNLDILKQEHISLVQLSESQLADMASKICSLQMEIECKNRECEGELDKAVNAEMEISILRTFAKDLEEKNFSILLECQNLLEASKLSKKLISELENENLEQHGELKSLFAHLEELRMKLYLVMKTLELDVDQQCGDKAQQDKILLDNVLEKLQQTHELLCKVQDDNQQLDIQKTVLITLIDQLQLEVSNLVAAKISLDNELMATSEKLLLSQSDCQKLTALTEELRLKVMEGDQKEQDLKVELSKLQEDLMQTVEAKQNLQEESFRLQDEQKHLMHLFSYLKEQKSNLEEENCAIAAASLSQSILSLMLRDVIHENSAMIKDLNGSLDKLSHANNDLTEKVKVMDGKLESLCMIENERLELERELAALKCKYDEVEISRAEGEKRIVKLSDDYDQHQREIECLRETKHKLESDIRKLRDELIEATRREDSLKCELEERRLETSQWESDVSATLGKLQMSTVREALFEGKVRELIEACESLDNRNCSNTLEIQQLKEKVGTLEGENGELKAQMHACIPAFVSLKDSIISLEDYTTRLHPRCETESKEEKDAPQLQERGEQIDEQSSMDSGVLLDLQELQNRIKAIEKALMEKEHEFVLANSKVGRRAKNGARLQKHSQEISEVMTKDIVLDHMSESSSHGLSGREAGQMMEIWENANQYGSIDLTVGKTEKVNSAGVEKKHKKQNPSAESLVYKEVSVDNLEISKRFSGTTQETSSRKILERLDSDAQKLTNLQITVQDLMKKVEITEKSKKGKDVEYHSVREQLGESEDAIHKLFDFNRKLVKNIEDDPVYSDDKEAPAPDAKSRVNRRSIVEQARRGSEKIGRLQLEVQKLQFLLLKLDDQNKSGRGKTEVLNGKASVHLRDYLYGGGLRSGSKQSKKKSHFCGCVQPPTKGDC